MPDTAAAPQQRLTPEIIDLLRCPLTGSRLRLEDNALVSEVGNLRYAIRDGIPVLLAEEATLPPGIESLDQFKQQFGSQFARRA